MKKLLYCLLGCLMLATATWASTRPISKDQAFGVIVETQTPNQINMHFRVTPGYYLYRQRFHFAVDPKTSFHVAYPASQRKGDKKRGYQEVYDKSMTLPMTLENPPSSVALTIHYQGCSASGFCYPPTQQTMNINFSHPQATSSTPTLSALLTDQTGVRDMLAAASLGMVLLMFVGLGLLLSLTPCVLPMVPILTSIIVGHKEQLTTRKAFLLSITYVLGSSLTYAAAGLLAATLGQSLQGWLQQTWIIVLTSGLFALLALSLFGLYELRLPNTLLNRIAAINHQQKGGTYVGVFAMGVISTLIVSPCVTAPLVGVLMYIAQTGDKLLGASALFAMGIGMGIPLIAVGVSAGKVLPRRGPWMEGVKKAVGVLMLGMAVWMLSRTPFFNVVTQQDSFKVVHNVTELQQQLAEAHQLNKPVLLDFYADWCESCVVMDKHVFAKNAVKEQLSGYLLLRADVTANDLANEGLLKQFNVVAPPTVLFFNGQGKELERHRIVGEVDAKEFIKRVHTVSTAACKEDKHAC